MTLDLKLVAFKPFKAIEAMVDGINSLVGGNYGNYGRVTLAPIAGSMNTPFAKKDRKINDPWEYSKPSNLPPTDAYIGNSKGALEIPTGHAPAKQWLAYLFG